MTNAAATIIAVVALSGYLSLSYCSAVITTAATEEAADYSADYSNVKASFMLAFLLQIGQAAGAAGWKMVERNSTLLVSYNIFID